ncbi:MAG: hypothetical protein JST20_11075 [Bacteroidetes bacterium]|jgi:hypothetical protein|nr:hypothetical protein [Bacteroidota bacterium]
MDSSFLILLISGRTEQVRASRYELNKDPNTKRLVYNFYAETDKSSRCFFACEDIIGIIPADMRLQAFTNQ